MLRKAIVSIGRCCKPGRTGIACGVLLLAAAAAGGAEDCLGPSSLLASRDGKTLYVVCSESRQLAWVELPGGRIIRRMDLPAEPTGLVSSPGGTELFVTCAAPRSTVAVIDAASGKLTGKIPAGHTATGPSMTPDGKRLYICNRFDNDVSVIDLAVRAEVFRVKAVREPVASAITPDGKVVLVANHLPLARTDVLYSDPVASIITFIDTDTNETTDLQLPNGSHSLRGLCLSPDGRYAYVTHILSNFDLAPTQVDMGWININTVSVIDVREKKLINTIGLDESYSGAGNPWGLALGAGGKFLCVSHSGTHELSIVEAPAMLKTLIYLYISPLAGSVPEDLDRGIQPRRRIQLPGKGPRGLAVVGSKIYAAEYFSDTIAVVDLTGKGEGPVRQIPLGSGMGLSSRRRGEMLFNDATICYQHWQSCASCHPDGRTDAINWDLMNDGVGNHKNTKSMLFSYKTPPSMAEGVRKSMEDSVRAGVQNILFSNLPEEDTAAIDEYLRSLEPVTSPYLVDGRLGPAAERGKKLFQGVGCKTCHPPPLYTDLKMHDVGTGGLYGVNIKMDTPTLIEVWRTAPYLNDGRYISIQELITRGKHGKNRGPVESLSEQEIEDLAAFVLSL